MIFNVNDVRLENGPMIKAAISYLVFGQDGVGGVFYGLGVQSPLEVAQFLEVLALFDPLIHVTEDGFAALETLEQDFVLLRVRLVRRVFQLRSNSMCTHSSSSDLLSISSHLWLLSVTIIFLGSNKNNLKIKKLNLKINIITLQLQ